MRAAAVVLVAAALGGCDHLYGAADGRLSDARLVEIARAATGRDGDGATYYPQVRRDRREATVSFVPKSANYIGGEVYVTIDLRTRKVVRSLVTE